MEQQSVPNLIGDIQLGDLVGQGAMGQVYRAEQRGQRVAVKVVNPRLLRLPRVVARFRAEARILMRIAHPNVVHVLDCGDLPDGTLYLVMEWLDGVGLDEVMQQRGKLSLEEALPYVEQICGALEAAHDLGVVHRDLKPENVMVLHQRPLTLKVLDFGVAKQINPTAASAELTTVGELVGTPLNMAPEQIDHRLGYTVGPWTDTYAVGLLLYNMLSGVHPFEAESLSGVLIQNLHKEPEPLRDLAPELPAPVAEVVHGCLQKDPALRPASARELIAALHHACLARHAPTSPAELGDDPTTFYRVAPAPSEDDEQTEVNFDVPPPAPAPPLELPPAEYGEPPPQATQLIQPAHLLPRQRRRRHAWVLWLLVTLCALSFEVAVALVLVLA